MNATQLLKAHLSSNQPVIAPGAPDALTARFIEDAGFPAVYMTGFGASGPVKWSPSPAPAPSDSCAR